MENIGTKALQALDRAVGTEAGRVTRLHALALQAARDREGLPVAFDRDVDQNIPRGVLTAWKPDGRPRPLQRPLTTGERGAVEARAAALELALMPFSPEQRTTVEAAVGAMFNGFRAMRQQGDDIELSALVTLGVLRDFPAWAIERACLKIARHEVGLDARYAPNDGQIADVVREVTRPYRQAFEQASGLLSGTVEAGAAIPPPRSQRPSYDELVARCRDDGLMIGANRRERGPSDPKAEQVENNKRANEYLRAGLQIPEAKDGLIVSLPMMLSMGWRIEEGPNGKMLVSPRKQEAEA